MEFRTRKAHRWVVRDKDLLKYWAVMITCVIVYLASGTISTVQHTDYTLWNVNAVNSSRSAARVDGSGIRVRGDGGGGRNLILSNASFLLHKARVLRREFNVTDRQLIHDYSVRFVKNSVGF